MGPEPLKLHEESARELAERLVPLLETVANLHFLLDMHIESPERLKRFRAIEDEAFEDMLKLVTNHLNGPTGQPAH